MKRLAFALAILTVAGAVLGALRNATIRYQRQADAQAQTLASESRLVAEARTRFTSITQQVRDLTRKVREARAATSVDAGGLDDTIMDSAHPTAQQSERLLAELGFNWATTGDYLIVSKDTLRAISVNGLRGAKLNQTACDVLAITPDERASIESTTQDLVDRYKAWGLEHLRREEPTGDVVAKYTLPHDNDFSLSLSNSFASAVTSAIGTERTSFLLDYCSSWMVDLGLGGGGDSVLTVKRYQAGDEPHLSFVLDAGGNRMSTDVAPYQEFPEAFLPLFPNGWTDLARREGFALPKSFTQNP